MRHGEADHNLTHTYNSLLSNAADKVSNLTPKGRMQTVEAAQKLFDIGLNPNNIAKVFVSPLPRTVETANVLANAVPLFKGCDCR